MSEHITFRPTSTADEPFLLRLYRSTRESELEQTGWNETEKETFVQQQFQAQHIFYTSQFPRARFNMVCLDDKPIGRLYVDRRKEEIRIIDIALLPEYRNRGIGSKLLTDILSEAEKFEKAVRIHVEHFNPALNLYERLGFKKTGNTGVYFLMEWVADKTT